MGTCGCHWARGRREAPAAKVAAGGRMPLARHALQAGGCRGAGLAYAPLHCSLAAALTLMGLRHRSQSGCCHDRARLPQTYAIMGRGRRPQCEAHLRYPAHFEYTAAIYCHEGAPFPSEAFSGIHRGKILPSSDTRERITSTYRHRQALGNAFRGHLAVAERPRAHCEHTLLCAGLRGIQFAGICRHARPPDDAPRQHIASKATLRLRKGQHARSHRTPPEPIRGMRRCPAAAVGAAAMKEPEHWRARPTGGRGRDIDARRLPGAREGHRRAPSAGCGGALTCGLPGVRGPSAAGSQPAGAWSRLGRAAH